MIYRTLPSSSTRSPHASSGVVLAGIDDPDAVVVTGYSAGGFATALLSDDIFSNYFPNAKSKNVLVDSSLLLHDDWHSIATDVWQTPKEISDKLVSNNLTLDCLSALHDKYGDGINLLFDSSTRDGDLAKVQNYFETGVMDVTEESSDIYQQILKDTIPQFKECGVSLFIWDGVAWYDDPRNMTAHTILQLLLCGCPSSIRKSLLPSGLMMQLTVI